MKHRQRNILRKMLLLFAGVLLLLTACVREDYYDNTRRGNYEALWKIMNEHYCFFSYKQQEIGVDWDDVHARYATQVNEQMTNAQLFEVLCKMLAELKDGHVNLAAPFDFGRNWSFHEDYPAQYNDSIAKLYLGYDYAITAGLKYVILDDNIGYVRCETFEDAIGDGNVSAMLQSLASCNGLIIDVRGNGGGQLTAAQTLASHFTNEKILVGFVSHKTGKGRDDFSSPRKLYLEPASGGVRWQKPVVVLTNRAVYSAANDFVKCMKYCPKVTIMGDHTGGGSGMPFSSELPNGWVVRYSSVIYYDRDMQHTEFGIAPDVSIVMSGADIAQKKDTYIEKAREYLSTSQ